MTGMEYASPRASGVPQIRILSVSSTSSGSDSSDYFDSDSTYGSQERPRTPSLASEHKTGHPKGSTKGASDDSGYGSSPPRTQGPSNTLVPPAIVVTRNDETENDRGSDDKDKFSDDEGTTIEREAGSTEAQSWPDTYPSVGFGADDFE